MTTTPATQAILPEDIERAEKFRRGIGGRYDRDVDQMAAEFARCRQAHSLPGDAHPDLEGHIADAVRDACGIVLGKVVSFDESRGIAATIADRIKVANAEYAAALTPSALSGDAGEVWQPIETCPMWAVAVVTDGISVAISQRAEADDGTPYWAIDPEDGLDWEPTYWVPALDEQLPSHPGAGE